MTAIVVARIRAVLKTLPAVAWLADAERITWTVKPRPYRAATLPPAGHQGPGKAGQSRCAHREENGNLDERRDRRKRRAPAIAAAIVAGSRSAWPPIAPMTAVLETNPAARPANGRPARGPSARAAMCPLAPMASTRITTSHSICGLSAAANGPT